MTGNTILRWHAMCKKSKSTKPGHPLEASCTFGSWRGFRRSRLHMQHMATHRMATHRVLPYTGQNMEQVAFWMANKSKLWAWHQLPNISGRDLSPSHVVARLHDIYIIPISIMCLAWSLLECPPAFLNWHTTAIVVRNTMRFTAFFFAGAKLPTTASNML